MSNLIAGQGNCLCGSVHVSAKTMTIKAGGCHCSICQKWAGGFLIMVDCGSDVSFQDEENVAVFNSSEWAERGFCKKCGSHLFYRLKARNQYFIPVGIFDGVEQFIFDHQIFIEDKPEYYCFSNETQNMTGAEVFAMFAPETESRRKINLPFNLTITDSEGDTCFNSIVISAKTLSETLKRQNLTVQRLPHQFSKVLSQFNSGS